MSVVRLDEDALNQVFETLSDWERILQEENIDVSALSRPARDNEIEGGPEL